MLCDLLICLQLTHRDRDNEYPPCFFNPLCTCSKAVPDLGIVSCRDVPLPRIPPPINSSKVFMLTLENNGMSYLESHFLEGTGRAVIYVLIFLRVEVDICPEKVKFFK